MKPIKADDANMVLGPPPGEDTVNSMWVKRTMQGELPLTTSTWMLDEEELAKVLGGANIKLTVWGPHPPSLLWI